MVFSYVVSRAPASSKNSDIPPAIERHKERVTEDVRMFCMMRAPNRPRDLGRLDLYVSRWTTAIDVGLEDNAPSLRHEARR